MKGGKIDAATVMSVSDARKVSTDIAMKSWQRKWDEDSKGRRTYELIPTVGTKILWPRKRDIGILYGRLLLNDTMLNYRMIVTVQEPLSLRSVFVEDNETVHHILLHCSRYSDAMAQLHDTVEGVYNFAKSGHSVTHRVNFIIPPPCDNDINMKENLFVKEALFQFIANIDRKL